MGLTQQPNATELLIITYVLVVAQQLPVALAYKHKLHSAHVTHTWPLPAGFDTQAGGISIEAGLDAAVHGLSQQAADLQLQPMHHHQQQLPPGGNISRGGDEARHPVGGIADTPDPGLLPDNLRKDMHNHNKGRSASNHIFKKSISFLNWGPRCGDLRCSVCQGLAIVTGAASKAGPAACLLVYDVWELAQYHICLHVGLTRLQVCMPQVYTCLPCFKYSQHHTEHNVGQGT
jgi:hypothetical protein